MCHKSQASQVNIFKRKIIKRIAFPYAGRTSSRQMQASAIPGEGRSDVPEQTVSQKDRVDAYITRVVSGRSPEKEEAGAENPTIARTARSLPSGHSSEPRKERSDTRGNDRGVRSDDRDMGHRPSVKKELEEIKRSEAQKKAAIPVPEKSTEHIAPPVKKPQVKERG